MVNAQNTKGEEATGTVIDALPDTLFRLRLEGGEGKEILAYLSGKMKLNRIKVIVGDKVRVIIDPYGGKGRINKRL